MRKFRCFMLAVVFLVECFINYAHTAGPQRRFSSRINQRQRPEVSDPTTPSSLSDLVTISTSRPQFPRVQQNPVLSTTTTTKITTVKPATTRITTVSTTAPIVTTEALPAEGEAPAGIFHLNSTFFAPSTDLNLDPQLLPGLSSGFVTVPSKFRPDIQSSDRTRLKDSGPPAGRKCTVKLDGATGTCAQFGDVILGHTCVSMSTALSDHCSDGQVCCFVPTVNKAAAMEYDQVPCGQRKLNESSIALVLDAQIARARVFDTFSARIIGGVPAKENEICWQAAIMADKEYACGGAIIDSRHVITAAHCIQDIESVRQVRVRIGHRNLNIRGRCSESFEVSQIVFHDQYDPESFAFDMAIINLAAPITNPECSCRICLPDKQDEAPSSKSCIISGYGTTQPDKPNTGGRELNIGNVNIVSDCTSRIKQDKSIPSTFVVDPSMVCAVGEDPSRLTDTCDVDAGSSLACLVSANSPNVYKLVGLASWGFPCGSNNQQSGPRVPTVYSNVPHVVNWIKDVQKQTDPDI